MTKVTVVGAGLVKSAADLYYLEPQSVAALERMGKKSAENLMEAIKKSKGNDHGFRERTKNHIQT